MNSTPANKAGTYFKTLNLFPSNATFPKSLLKIIDSLASIIIFINKKFFIFRAGLRIKRNNTLLVPFCVMTGSIIVLSLLSQFLINSSLNDMKSDANVISQAGRQRMLSQQIVKEIAADNLMGKIDMPLDSLLKTFSHLHNALLNGDKSLNLKPLEKKFLKEYYKLDEYYNQFLASVERTVNSEINNEYFLDMMNKQELYLSQVNRFIAKMDGYSNSKINKFQLIEIGLMTGCLTIIFFEVIFIFLPAINKINRQNEQFKSIAFNQSHVIRQPIANIKGLLHLIASTKPDDSVKELIHFANAEAEKLDTVIKNNVFNTSQV